MKISLTGMQFVLASVLFTASLAGQQSSAMTPQEQANLKFVLDLWREVLDARHLELTSKYQADDYIQHNINVPTGRQGFVRFFSQIFNGRGPAPIQPALASPPAVSFAKGDFVALIWEREAKDPATPSKTYKYNTYDLLRLQNGKVQEHWDYALKTKGTPRGGAPYKVEGCDILTIRDGKIAAKRSYRKGQV